MDVSTTKNLSPPDPQEWSCLQEVVRYVAIIVDDDPVSPTGLSSGGTLLTGFGQEAHGPPLPPRSVLAGALASRTFFPARGGSFNGELAPPYAAVGEELLEILPGVDQIGATRAERIEALTKMLPQIPAYAWLMRGTYPTALAHMKKKGKSDPAYASDDAEFRLLDVIIDPLWKHLHAMAHANKLIKYPTRKAVENALKNVTELNAFLNGSTALHMTGRLDWNTARPIVKLGQELGALLKDAYKPPKEAMQVSSLQTHFLDTVIERAAKAFGSVYVPMVQAVAGIIDYHPERPFIYKRAPK
jgi:hypothetical protein